MINLEDPRPHEYFKLKDLSVYSGLSVRKLRALVKDSDHPLPCFRVGGLIVVRRSEFDAWMEKNFRVREDFDEIVDGVINGL